MGRKTVTSVIILLNNSATLFSGEKQYKMEKYTKLTNNQGLEV